MQDWMIVLIIGAVVIFGASKLPQIARNMGKAQGEFKKGLKEGVDEPEAAAAPPATSPRPAPAPEQTAPAPEQASTPPQDAPGDQASP